MGILGDISHYLILILTFGQGKRIANAIAKLFGYEDCGCNDRRTQLNNWLLPEHKKQYPIR